MTNMMSLIVYCGIWIDFILRSDSLDLENFVGGNKKNGYFEKGVAGFDDLLECSDYYVWEHTYI